MINKISFQCNFNEQRGHTASALSSSRSEAAIQSIAGFKEHAMQACKRACKKEKQRVSIAFEDTSSHSLFVIYETGNAQDILYLKRNETYRISS